VTLTLSNRPCPAGVLERMAVTDGFPDLTWASRHHWLGRPYVTAFASTRDFGCLAQLPSVGGSASACRCATLHSPSSRR
jgi:hypothetical protein